MTHRSRLAKAVVDIPSDVHDEELAFWNAALGRPLTRSEEFPEFHGTRLGSVDFALLVQKLDSGQSRVHLDVHTDDVDAEVARLEGLGATRVRRVAHLWIMRDPAGLPFCVTTARPGELDESNSTLWE